MGTLINNAQERFKNTSNAFALMAFKAFAGLFLGLTLALIGDQIIDYGWISFMLVLTVTAGTLMKVTRSWTWMHMLIFTLICVLIGLLLRMYILIAPG